MIIFVHYLHTSLLSSFVDKGIKCQFRRLNIIIGRVGQIKTDVENIRTRHDGSTKPDHFEVFVVKVPLLRLHIQVRLQRKGNHTNLHIIVKEDLIDLTTALHFYPLVFNSVVEAGIGGC